MENRLRSHALFLTVPDKVVHDLDMTGQISVMVDGHNGPRLEKAIDRFVSRLVREKLIDNMHRVRVVMCPEG